MVLLLRPRHSGYESLWLLVEELLLSPRDSGYESRVSLRLLVKDLLLLLLLELIPLPSLLLLFLGHC